MSLFVVENESGLETSSPSELTQNEAQGELGVTRKALEYDMRSPRKHVRRKSSIMSERQESDVV